MKKVKGRKIGEIEGIEIYAEKPSKKRIKLVIRQRGQPGQEKFDIYATLSWRRAVDIVFESRE